MVKSKRQDAKLDKQQTIDTEKECEHIYVLHFQYYGIRIILLIGMRVPLKRNTAMDPILTVLTGNQK